VFSSAVFWTRYIPIMRRLNSCHFDWASCPSCGSFLRSELRSDSTSAVGTNSNPPSHALRRVAKVIVTSSGFGGYRTSTMSYSIAADELTITFPRAVRFRLPVSQANLLLSEHAEDHAEQSSYTHSYILTGRDIQVKAKRVTCGQCLAHPSGLRRVA
jgi:hypothetical protein